MSRAASLSALLALAVALALPARAGEPRRWPLWPSEVTRAAEPLVVVPESGVVREGRRVAAVRDLDAYATPLVAPILVAALADRSSLVRREVLHACLERQLMECVPAARQIWQRELDDPALRVAALRVVVMGPDPDRLQLFLAALRDADALIRAESLRTFAAAAWPRDQVPIVRANLIARLADPTPEVRRAAVHGLGVLGPDPPPAKAAATAPRSDAALPLARLLTDPDPQVRQDTAEALARLRDPRAAPAILRALQVGDETYVGRALLHALAALPGPRAAASEAGSDGVDIDAELLRLLDAPPRNLVPRHVAEAIARRRGPGPALPEGLVARLREDALRQSDPNFLRQPVLDALLGLGAAARPALRAALARGLEPPLEREVRRLLAALDPPDRAILFDQPWPEDQDRAAWRAALADPEPAARLRAAAALAARSPAWLGGAAGLHLERAGTAERRRPWLVALAGSGGWTSDDPALPARLDLWADDVALASGDRCLALAALARRHDREGFTRAALRLAAAPEPAIRACVAGLLAWMSPRTADPLLDGLLRDPSARVRTGAALALACRDAPSPALAPRLAWMAARDPDPAVVRAVDLARSAPEPCERWGLVHAPAGESGAFVAVRWRGREILALAETLGPLRLAWGPGLDRAEAAPGADPAIEPLPSPRGLFD